tara:strand:+ start:639 stop:1832 length:1194 start_codon:yes stop_codon:yes gene_type:complete
MQIEKLETNKLIPYVNNSRTHSENQVSQVAASITEFGFNNPILIDKKNTIIAGHGRLLAAQKLGLPEVPCVRLEHLTETQKKAYIIADNKLALNAGWDEELLSLELKGLEEDGFDTSLIGFDEKEMAQILSGNPKDGLTGDDELPEVSENAQTKEGNLYQLGVHRLLCGDSTEENAVNRLFDGQTVDLLLTDPPYGVNYAEKNTFLNNLDQGKRVQKHIQNDEIVNLDEFLGKFLQVIPFSETNIFYIFFAGQQLHHIESALNLAKLKLSQYLVWNKNNHVLSRTDYLCKHEFILYGWKNKHKFYGKKGKTVIDHPRPLKNELHPTMKPVGLLTRLIEDGSLPNQNIFDPFLGSGSTLIAAEKTNRKCFGIEKDPIYCDVIVKRWEDFTGSKAKLID